MKPFSLLGLPAPLLLLLGFTYGDQLPYNPTRIFRSPQNNRIAYVLRPVSTSSSQSSLSSLDLSSQLTASSLQYTSLYSTLPFLNDGTSAPLNAVMDSGGNITIYTGGCSPGGSSAQIWKLNPQTNEVGAGGWKQKTLTQAGMTQSGGMIGSNFLATGIAFSSNASASDGNTKLYFFGGMCPLATATPASWQSSANYSGSMLAFTPNTASNAVTYDEGLTAMRTQPIPEAGHSITPLEPTYSNKTDGTQTQQQDFVLLGGHTKSAFLNMSQVGLFSLPQEAWTYFPVKQQSGNGHTDLAVRQQTAQIDPRSGHTAVLTSDGKKIILLGGWVGDVNTPANPQLAILNVGAGYGGQNDWTWSVPATSSGPGLATNAGIYGHGAIMLPGNVMLVVGGYAIAAPASVRVRRATPSQSMNTKTFLYNVTSNSWISEYTAPSGSITGSALSDTGPLSTTSQKAGLGAGLGIGAAAVAGCLVLYLWYRRRLRQRRENRESEIRTLAFTAHPYDSDEWGIAGGDGRNSANFVAADLYSDREKAAQYTSPYPAPRPDQPGWRGTSAQDAERTGLLVEIPSPTRGLRRNTSGRGAYSYEKRASRNMENIHPIAERDEDDPGTAAAGASEMSKRSAELQTRTSALLANTPNLDPFIVPMSPLGSHPISLEESTTTGRTAADREHEVQGWVSEWEKAAEALISAPEMASSLNPRRTTGRISPDRSERTSSTLSDQSTHSSTVSYLSNSGVSGIARSLSTRSAAFLNSLTSSFGGPAPSSPTTEKPMHQTNSAISTLPSQQKRQSRARGNSFTTTAGATAVSRPVTSASTASRPTTSISIPRTDDSFSTARTSLAQVQAEGEALLGGYHPDSPTKPGYKSAPSSPVRGKKNVSWVGSVKRALSGAYGGRSASLTAASARYDNPSSSMRPTLSTSDSTPRRAASDAGFWKGKRGARDWSTEDNEAEATSAATHEADDAGGDEDDWDVERAAEGRVVQLMFTVPRQRLRVVNADVDGRSLISFDEGERETKKKDEKEDNTTI